jgi:hypothetical protein
LIIIIEGVRGHETVWAVLAMVDEVHAYEDTNVIIKMYLFILASLMDCL